MSNTTNNTHSNNLYNTKLYSWKHSSDYIVNIIKQLHIYGIGIRLGMDELEHFHKVVREAQGNSALAVFSGDTLVGAVLFHPVLQENSHYPGKSVYTTFIVMEPGHTGAMHKAIRNLRYITQGIGADWLVITRATSDTTYLEKAWRLNGH